MALGAHFAMPAALILIAVPRPTGMEQAVVQGMTRAVTTFTLDALVWTGSSAVQSGNVILLANGALGVDEACSGVRSSQSNLMAALVVGGGIYRLGAMRRILFPGRGAGSRILAQPGAGFRVGHDRCAGRGGGRGVWHDPAGYTILFLSFGLLLGAAKLM